jgi:hypothetical protein
VPKSVVTTFPLPQDFANEEVPKTDPLQGLKSLPKGDDLSHMQRRLFDFCTGQVADFIKTVRSSFKTTNPVSYTQAQHVGIQAALGFVLTQARLLAATGRDRRDALERKLLARIEALEARPQLQYQGVWSTDKVYGEGNLSTDQGSLFHANRATVGERPGSSDAWTLVAKRGRDGKDAR